MRSFTEASGLKNSSFASTRAFGFSSADSRGSPTKGVSPMVSMIDSYTLPRPAFVWRAGSYAASVMAGSPLVGFGCGPVVARDRRIDGVDLGARPGRGNAGRRAGGPGTA